MNAPALRPYQAPSREAVGVVLEAIGAGGARGGKVARILPRLVVAAAPLGELVEYDAVAHGERVVGRGMRAEWFERLATAIVTESIDAFTADQVVEILLRPRA